MEKRDMAPLVLPSEGMGVPADRAWSKDPGRSREKETFTLGIKHQSPSHLPSSARERFSCALSKRSYLQLATKNKHSLTSSAPLTLDLLHSYLNVRDDISLSQVS